MHELTPIPHSTLRQSRIHSGIRVGVSVPPSDVIQSIWINHAAKDMLPYDLHYIATKEYMRANIWMSVPQESAEKCIITPASSGRAVPIAYGEIPFGSSLGRVITGKGSWLAGCMVGRAYDRILPRRGFPGLLSMGGARGDMNASQILIDHHFRSAMHLGFAVFDSEKLKDWLLQEWRGDTTMVSTIRMSFDRIAKQTPAYLFRIGGSMERYVNNIGTTNQRTMVAELRRAARLLLAESRISDSHVARALKTIGDDRILALAALDSMSEYHNVTAGEFLGYTRLLAAMYGQNAHAILTSQTSGDLRIAGWMVSDAKDVDYAHFTYDYDVATGDKHKFSPQQNRVGYVGNISREGARHLDSIRHYLMDPANFNKTDLSEDRFDHEVDRFSQTL